jgi:hypothetical protein
LSSLHCEGQLAAPPPAPACISSSLKVCGECWAQLTASSSGVLLNPKQFCSM